MVCEMPSTHSKRSSCRRCKYERTSVTQGKLQCQRGCSMHGGVMHARVGDSSYRSESTTDFLITILADMVAILFFFGN